VCSSDLPAATKQRRREIRWDDSPNFLGAHFVGASTGCADAKYVLLVVPPEDVAEVLKADLRKQAKRALCRALLALCVERNARNQNLRIATRSSEPHGLQGDLTPNVWAQEGRPAALANPIWTPVRVATAEPNAAKFEPPA